MTKSDTPTTNDDVAIRRKIRLITKHANELKRMTPTDAGLADAVGHTRGLERNLEATRHRWERLTAEMEPVPMEDRPERVNPNERTKQSKAVAVGQDFELVPTGKNDYSFNTPAILVAGAAVMDDGQASPTDVLMDIIGSGAAKLTFTITKLQAWCSSNDVTLSIGSSTVTNDSGLDAPMVGKVWRQTGVQHVALKREG